MSVSDQQSGLLPVSDVNIFEHAPHEVIALLSAQKCDADYVYFKHFADGRPSIPQVYIYDNTKSQLSNSRIAEIHRKVWNRGEALLMYVFSETVVDILSCARKPDFLSKSGSLIFNPAKTIALASESQAELDRFSGKMFDNGMFWVDPETSRLINKNKAAHQSLVVAVNDFDKKIAQEGSLPEKVGRRLLILCILVKYLEDRGVFPEKYFKTFLPEAISFFDVLQDATATIMLFNKLEERFNGDVFALTTTEKKSLTTERLQEFAEFIEARTRRKQLHFWELYTFEDIPVEIISYIYQNFVTGTNAVYTPHFLVDLLLDESMPLDDLQSDFKVFDPACGSGVFLVGAYKRLVIAWRYRNGWKRPSARVLKKLLINNIFGVDLDDTAVELTAFSLCLALCDALQPNVIWQELKFDQLKVDNIVCADFFGRKIEASFDLLIGNPPFDSKLTTTASKQINTKYAAMRGKLPDTQISYLFLEHCFKFLKTDGALCLILPHGILYNYGTQDFRRHIFSSWHVEEVLDFISVRGLFTADVKVCALLMRNCLPDGEKSIAHITFRRNRNTHEQLYFEIDHYDIHLVPRDLATSERLIWRANLLGGARVFTVIERLLKQRTLKEFIDEKGWEYGEGFIAGTKGKPADFLTDKKCLPTVGLTEEGVDRSRIKKLQSQKFISPRNPKRYAPPMILIKANDLLPMVFWDECYLTFRDKIISISGGKASELKNVFQRISGNHRDYQFFLSLIGSQALTGKATAPLKRDIDNLPYPNDPEKLLLSKTEKILRDDVLDFIQLFIRRGDKSELLRRKPSSHELKQFGEVYSDLLRSVYNSIKPHKPLLMSGLICFPFYFGDKPEIEIDDPVQLEENLTSLVRRQHHKTLQVSRLVRLYEGNIIYLIKPNLLRYWIRSVAVRDADETFVELREQGF